MDKINVPQAPYVIVGLLSAFGHNNEKIYHYHKAWNIDGEMMLSSSSRNTPEEANIFCGYPEEVFTQEDFEECKAILVPLNQLQS